MTDRINAFLVILDKNYRDDDVQQIARAIGMIKGVMAVEPNVADVEGVIAETRVRRELEGRLWEALRANKASENG